MWNTLSEKRTDLLFAIAAGPGQHRHFWSQLPQYSRPYFTVSDLKLPQPGVPGPRIYILLEKGALVLPPGTGFPFLVLPTTYRDTVEVFEPPSTWAACRFSLFDLNIDHI
jgi:hypothetical protein